MVKVIPGPAPSCTLMHFLQESPSLRHFRTKAFEHRAAARGCGAGLLLPSGLLPPPAWGWTVVATVKFGGGMPKVIMHCGCPMDFGVSTVMIWIKWC